MLIKYSGQYVKIYFNMKIKFVSLYSSAASLSSRSSVAFFSSASSFVYASAFTPISSSSSFFLHPLSYRPRPSVLYPAPRASTPPPPPPPSFPPLPPGLPPLYSSSSFATSLLLLSLLLFLFLSLPPEALISLFLCWSLLCFPLLFSFLFRSFRLFFFSHASSSLVYTSFQAHVLIISDQSLSLVRWYHSVAG